MKLSRFCFVLAAASAISAATFVAAGTYPNQRCVQTPGQVCQGQCGCQVPNTPSDLCGGNTPAPGNTWISYYYCNNSSMTTCTDDGWDNGCQGTVYNCSCWTCDGSSGGCMCPGSSTCTPDR